MTFDITITETLSRTTKIVAENYDEAIKKAKEMYINQEIVLDSSDFVDYAIE